MVEQTQTLTSSLEDYLEVIAELAEQHKEVRGSLIAERLKVKRPSVTYAVHLLSEKGLVEFTPYGPIVLTEKGHAEAAEVRRRHAALRLFLSKILGVEEQKAAAYACRIEHVVDDEITSRLVEFLDFIEHCPTLGNGLTHICDGKCQHHDGSRPRGKQSAHHINTPLSEEIYALKASSVTLDTIPAGSSAFVVQIHGSEKQRHFLTELGFTRNTTIRVIRAAPLGDPVEVQVRGTRLSLSLADAKNIEVIACGGAKDA
ncbi:MAG: metal-dependent transcriptional regulator [Planctomycetia bacterium]|nr:metal-dependent transcriptional regulator [Planctomycetia bacterium]